jgi:hypothetical protein
MIVAALLGTIILTDVTQVAGRVVAEPGESMPRRPAAGAENHEVSGRLLVLTGIIAYPDPRQGFAIIGSSVESTHVARPGEQLPDGSSIREIYPMHVVLEYGGRLEKVGIHERGEPVGAAHVELLPLPQHAVPNQAPRPTDEARNDLRPSDTRASETVGNERRSYDTQSMDAPQERLQPEAPLPSAPDPADELSDDRRQRGGGRGK